MGTPSAKDVLRTLQERAYRARGRKPPVYTADDCFKRRAKNIEALQPGGVVERDFVARGMPAESAAQYVAHLLTLTKSQTDQDCERLVAAFRQAPTEHENPWWYEKLLRVSNKLVERCTAQRPDMPLRQIAAKATLGTLPLGEPNAFVAPVSGSDEFVVLFDPTLFEVVDVLAEKYAQLLQLAQNAENRAEFEAAVRRECDERVRAVTVMTLTNMVVEGSPGIRDEPASRLGGVLSVAYIAFVLAHEYSHLLLKHVDARAYGPNQERQADALGCYLIHSLERLDGATMSPILMGMTLYFSTLALVDVARETLANGQQAPRKWSLSESPDASRTSPTHGSAMERLGGVFAFLAGRIHPDSSRQASVDIEKVLTITRILWSLAEPAFLEMHGRGVRAARVWRSLSEIGIA